LDRDLVLHVYSAALHPALRRSIPDRWQLQKEASFAGIPQLKFAKEDGELIWIIEDRLRGSPGVPHREEHFFEALEWLGRFATLIGPQLNPPVLGSAPILFGISNTIRKLLRPHHPCDTPRPQEKIA
jgi:hypothetical protein